MDDFSDSNVNNATSIGKPLPVDTLDSLVSLASRAIAGHGEHAEIRFRKEDFKGAFKSLPLRGEDLPCSGNLGNGSSHGFWSAASGLPFRCEELRAFVA